MKTHALHRIIGLAVASLCAIGIGQFTLQRSARAELVAVYVSGYGGVSAPQTDATPSQPSAISPALGLQAGARLLIFEVYGNYTSFGSGTSVARAILALRGGLDFGNTRLELRLGGGAISEQGGALTGPAVGTESRAGVVGRAGVVLERRLARLLLAGISVDGEQFAMAIPDQAEQSGGWTTGRDIFASLQLKFELGI